MRKRRPQHGSFMGIVMLGIVATNTLHAAEPPNETPMEQAQRLTAEGARLYAAGKLDEAMPLAERALSLRERELGPDHADVAKSTAELARLYLAKLDYAHAEPLFLRALAIREKTFGSAHPEVAQSMTLLASLYDKQGNYLRALPLYRRALAIQEKAFGPDHPNVAHALANLARLLYGNAEAARAATLYQRAIGIVEKSLGPDHVELPRYLAELADLYANTGRHQIALPLLERAVRINERAFGQESPKWAASLVALGLFYKHVGDYPGALRMLQRAKPIHEKALGSEHPEVGRNLDQLGGLHECKGEYAQALTMYRDALTLLEMALGPEHPDVATALNHLVSLEDRTLGERPSSEVHYRRALSIQEKTLGPDNPGVAISLNHLAHLAITLGNTEGVEALLQRAILIQKNTLGPEHHEVATTLGNLGHLAMNNADYAKADALFQQALSLREKIQGPEHPDVADALYDLGALHWLMHDATAETMLQRALDISEKTLGSNHPKRAAYLTAVGRVFLSKGEYGHAEPLYRHAVLIQQTSLGPDHPAIADTLNGLAILHAGQNRLADAVTVAREASEMRDRHAATILATGSEEQKRLYMNTVTRQTSLDISLHVHHAPDRSDAARLAFTDILRRKGRVLDAVMSGVAVLRRSTDPADQALLEQLTAVYSQFATHAVRGRGKMPPEQYRKELAILEQTRKKLEDEISQRVPLFRTKPNLVTLADVQARLPRDAALVEIARYTPVSFQRSIDSDLLRAPRYVAYLLFDHGDPAFVDLGEAASIDAAIDGFRAALKDHNLTHDPKPAARRLDERLMRPIRRWLGHRRWIFLSPDGPMHLVPFGALVDEQNHFLVEQYLISYLTTGREFLRFGEKRRDPRENPLILANPAFFNNQAPHVEQAEHRGLRSMDLIQQPLLPLESTVEEAQTIAGLFPKSRVLLGTAATEGAVKAAHAPRVLHLATHGFFLPEQPIPEALLRNVGLEPTPAERAALLRRENPLLRSGIALAGFNQRQSGNDDGVLTALETAALDLHGTKLVVLSTCESGLGEATSGEGVYGLRRALAIAGSETQVMSLWQVDTGRTRELMQAYYRRLQQGEGRSDAMREVQLDMLANSETAHPNLWASFIVSGEWRTLDGHVRIPEVLRVSPGLRGCACAQGHEAKSDRGWCFLLLGGAIVLRRRVRSEKA